MIKAADLDTLVDLFERSDWQSLQLEIESVSINLSKVGELTAQSSMSAQSSAAARQRVSPVAIEPTPSPAVKSPSRGSSGSPEGCVAVRAPNLGTFYRSPKPGAEPYVKVGQQVEPTTEVCMLEVMKLFTVVLAGLRGVVREVLVSDGELVEHDQVLILIEPSE